MDSKTRAASQFSLHQLRLQNFKRFEDVTLTMTPSRKIIVGANGSGKTQILWAIIVFLRGHNSRIPSSQHFKNTEFNFSGELQDLFGDRLFVNQYKAPHTLVRVGAPDKKFTLTGTFLDPTYHHTNENVMLEYSRRDGLLQDKPDNHRSLAPIRFAFMPPMYQWGDMMEERLRERMFLTAGVQHMRVRLVQAKKDFVNDGLRHLGLQATVSAVRDGNYGPVTATVTENGVTLDIGACAGSLQKIIAILTLLYHLTTDATIKAAQDDAREKEIAHDPSPFKQRIFLIDELEALLYENVTAKLYDFLVSMCDKHNIQLIVATNSRAIIDPRMKTDQQIMFLTPDGKVVELTGELPTDEQGHPSLYPILNALSQVKDSKPILVVEGDNDEEFYRKYTTLGQHFHFVTTSGAVNKQGVSNILTQAKLKHVFLRDSDMYAASPDLTAAQARITKTVGAPVIYTLLPCIESYLILHRLLNNADADTRRARVVQALQQRKLYFVSNFKAFCRESSDSALASASGPGETLQDRASDLASSENNDTMAMLDMVDRVHADSQDDSDVLWNEMLAQLTTKVTSTGSEDRVLFWTTYVKMVRGHDLMPNAASVMGGLKLENLHPGVKALLDQTEQAVLACVR